MFYNRIFFIAIKSRSNKPEHIEQYRGEYLMDSHRAQQDGRPPKAGAINPNILSDYPKFV